MAAKTQNVANLSSLMRLVQGKDPNSLSKIDMTALRMAVVEECFAGDLNPKALEVALKAIKELEVSLDAEDMSSTDQKLAAKLPPGTLTVIGQPNE